MLMLVINPNLMRKKFSYNLEELVVQIMIDKLIIINRGGKNQSFKKKKNYIINFFFFLYWLIFMYTYLIYL
jgi:hypothetical protein